MIDTTGESVELPWGSEKLTLRLPSTWRLAGILEPRARSAAIDPAAETLRALRAPIGSPPLGELAAGKRRVALVIDDVSRPTPVAALLPTLLAELDRAGVPRPAVTLFTALGVHRPMLESEVERRVGAGQFAGLRWENHACADPARLLSLGTTSRGTPVRVNRGAAESDLILSLGCIEPHLIASFGGGYKNLIPGLAGRETIARNHVLNCRPNTFNMVGQPIERNPMRLDLEEAGRMLKPPVFIVNAILDGVQRVARVVAGDPIQAHREGARLSEEIYGIPIAEPAEVVIADSHPMDGDLRQGSKAIANTIRAVRRGGVMLVLMRAEEGLGVMGIAERHLPIGPALLRLLAPLLIPLLPHLKLGGIADDERFYLYFALQAMRHCRLLVYAPTLSPAQRAALPFARFVESPEAGLEAAEHLVPAHARVLVFPQGGSTYPTPAGTSATT